jgi:predicted  nucleic acid-binding Zn-ribbon protein
MGYFLLFLVIVGFALVLISILPALLLLVSYTLIVYLSGRYFYDQLSRRYRLTEKSTLMLFGLALLAFLVAYLIISTSGTVEIPFQLLFEPVPISAGWLLIPLWALFFLITAVASLEIWGWTKLSPYLKEIYALQRKEQELSGEKRRLERQIERIRSRIERLEQACGRHIDQQEELEELAIELLQVGNPRVLQVARRRRMASLAQERDRSLMQREQEVLRELRRSHSEEKRIAQALEAVDLRLERLSRRIGRPAKERQAYRAQLQGYGHRQQNLTQELESLQRRRSHTTGQLRALRQSRITLD